jgi:hypothetical protein
VGGAIANTKSAKPHILDDIRYGEIRGERNKTNSKKLSAENILHLRLAKLVKKTPLIAR